MKFPDLFKGQFLRLARETSSNPQEAVKVLWREVIDSPKQILPSKVFEQFKLKNNIFGDILVRTAKTEGEGRYKILLNNSLGKELGYEEFSINPQNKNIFGFFINVSKDYKKSKFRFGELMRLLSVMEMNENKANHIKIYSKDTAVYFHAKYKFVPSIISFEARDKSILTVANDPSPAFVDLAEEAKNLYQSIERTKDDLEAHRNLCKPVNALVQRYIERALKEPNPEKNHPFTWGMDMILTKEKVQENKEFFNTLFEKRGIDYKI